MGRGRPAKFEGEQLSHVVSLVKEFGASKTRDILAAPIKVDGKATTLGKLRNAKLFPDPVEVSVPCLCNIGKANGVKLIRGRKNPIVTKQQKMYVAKLVSQHGATKTVEILASDARNTNLFPDPVNVSQPHVGKIARMMGVELSRGRRPTDPKEAQAAVKAPAPKEKAAPKKAAAPKKKAPKKVQADKEAIAAPVAAVAAPVEVKADIAPQVEAPQVEQVVEMPHAA